MSDIHKDMGENPEAEDFIPWDNNVYDEDYFQKRLTTLVYLHPFFTYHAVPLEDIGRQPAQSEELPYSIPIGTYEREKREQFTILPEHIGEREVLKGFRKRFKLCYLDEVTNFLDFQYSSYLEKAAPEHNPTLFLEYLITTIDGYGISARYDNLEEEYEKFKVLGKWVRSHPGWIEPFDQRLRNWVNLCDFFKEKVAKAHIHKQQEMAEADLQKEKDAAAKAQADATAQLIEEREAVVLNRLRFLSGFRTAGRKIMEQEDFDRLMGYTLKMVEEEKVPETIKPITVDVTTGHLRYTYYLIHKDLYGKKPKRKYFIDFLYAVFPSHFKEEDLQWSTTYTKFSQGPDAYKKDVENYLKIGKIGKL